MHIGLFATQTGTQPLASGYSQASNSPSLLNIPQFKCPWLDTYKTPMWVDIGTSKF